MSMFKTLAQQAAISPVTLTLFDAGDGALRVIIAQKRSADDKSHAPLNLAITGTPDELDAELPLALAEAAAAPTRTIAEQVKAQAASIAADEDDDEPAGNTKAAKKKTVSKKAVTKPTAKANAAAKTVQARDISAKPKAKASIKPAAKMAAPVIEPLIKKPAATAATPAPKKTAADIF